MAASATPQERFQAFGEAVSEEILQPTSRYLRGLRRGLLVGAVLGILIAPKPGAETRERLARIWRGISRWIPVRGER